MFNYFMKNKLLKECQTGFIPVASCIYQLLYISHEIYENFHCSSPGDKRRTSFDIAKVFDRILHGGSIISLMV